MFVIYYGYDFDDNGETVTKRYEFNQYNAAVNFANNIYDESGDVVAITQEDGKAMRYFATKQNLIDYEIEPALGEYLNEFDIDAIVEDAYKYVQYKGYILKDNIDFWEVVAKHAIIGK